MTQLLAVGMGGFMGACARYGLTKLLAGYQHFPLGVLLSNIIAGLFIGIIIGMERQNAALQPHIRLFMVTGLLGGLSTFCTFSLDTVLFIEGGNYLKAGLNVLSNNVLGMLAVFAGFMFANFVRKLI